MKLIATFMFLIIAGSLGVLGLGIETGALPPATGLAIMFAYLSTLSVVALGWIIRDLAGE